METESMTDIAKVEHKVEIEISSAMDKLWVNVDGVCKLRIQNIHKSITINGRKIRPKDLE